MENQNLVQKKDKSEFSLPERENLKSVQKGKSEFSLEEWQIRIQFRSVNQNSDQKDNSDSVYKNG